MEDWKRWRFVNNYDSLAVKYSTQCESSIVDIDKLKIRNNVLFFYNHGELINVLKPNTKRSMNHYTPHIINLSGRHDFQKDVEYDAVLEDWILHTDEYGNFYASGFFQQTDRLWETSYIDHILFFNDGITVVTQNKHHYTLPYNESRRRKTIFHF